MFEAAAVSPDFYKEKINVFIALAPVVKMNNTLSHALKFVSAHWKIVEFIGVDLLGLYSIVGPNNALNHIYTSFCLFFDPVCKLGVYLISDRDVHLDNMSRDDVYYSHFPSGCGYKNFVHYGQLIKEGGFSRYDYGPKKNLEVYG